MAKHEVIVSARLLWHLFVVAMAKPMATPAKQNVRASKTIQTVNAQINGLAGQ